MNLSHLHTYPDVNHAEELLALHRDDRCDESPLLWFSP